MSEYSEAAHYDLKQHLSTWYQPITLLWAQLHEVFSSKGFIGPSQALYTSQSMVTQTASIPQRS